MVGAVKTEQAVRDEGSLGFAGRAVGPRELALVREVVASCGGLSRAELAQTVCELLGWRRASGSLQGLECRRWLEELEAHGELVLPVKRARRPVGRRTRVPVSERGAAGPALVGTAGDLGPVALERVERPAERELFRELVGRYHYLGYRVAYGAQLRYLVFASRPRRQVVGCVQFSSPAWRLAARERWIGWDEATRRRNLQRVVANSRFLILPWVRVKNLASRVLGQAVRRVSADWPVRYEVAPLLAETLVDPARFRGTCYRAANWQELGPTSGRGRMDREHRRHGLAPKTVWIYPLVSDAARRLRES
jgi:hypothetical protein